MPALPRSLRAASSDGAAICATRRFLSSVFFRFFPEDPETFGKGRANARQETRPHDFPCQRAVRRKARLHTRTSPWRHSFRIRPAASALMRRKSAETGQPVRWFRPPPPREVMRYIWLAPFDCQAPFFNFFHPARHPRRTPRETRCRPSGRTTPLTESQPCAPTLTEACFTGTSALTCRNVRLLSGWQDFRRTPGPAAHRDAYGHLAIFRHDWHPLIWPCVE